MDLSIIILNYKTAKLCKTCIRGIKKIPTNIKYEIIVVDNDSNDSVGEILEQNFDDVIFIQSGANIGHPAGNNLGIQQARGRYILILNSDIAVLDNALEKMVQYMDEHPSVGAAGCKLMNPDGTLQFSCRKFYEFLTPLYSRTFFGHTKQGKEHLESFFMVHSDHSQNQKVDWVQGSCLIVKKELLDRIGIMDERFFLYFGDVDLCKRVWLSGFEVHYIAQASIVHYFHQQSAGGFSALLNPVGRIHIKDWMQYLNKYSLKKN